MKSSEFRKYGYEMIDLVANFMDTINQRDPAPEVQPGFLTNLVPKDPPEKPEPWKNIIKDIEPVIMQGMIHWQHPHFRAYFAAGNSWPSVMGDIISNALACNCATWETCPAGTELEVIVTDWAAKMLDLPKQFFSPWSNTSSKGGGVIQGSASEAIFIAIIAAREYAVAKLEKKNPGVDRAILNGKLVAYANNQSHSCIEKGCLMAGVRCVLLEPNAKGFLEGVVLRDQMKYDIEDGLTPFFLNCILGSTSIGAFDDLLQIAPLANEYDIWVHVDCAYAGSMFSCIETRHLKRGMQHAWSTTVNCNKWMLTNFDCCLMWVKYRHLLEGPLGGFEPIPKHGLPNYRHWGIANSRRFRAVKLWCVLRTYGQTGIRRYIRNHMSLAKRLERYILREGSLFEVIGQVRTGLICFAFRGISEEADDLTERLLELLNESRKIHMVPGVFNGKYVIRYAVTYEFAEEKHIDEDWNLIKDYSHVIRRLYPEDLKVVLKDLGPLQLSRLNLEGLSLEDMTQIQSILQRIKKYSFKKSVGVLDHVILATLGVLDDFTSHNAGTVVETEKRMTIRKSRFGLEEIRQGSFSKAEEEIEDEQMRLNRESVRNRSVTFDSSK